ncbi:protein FAR1-RELATED SEQUENCE 5-like [Humulus lupulus]|uniref:protein FAR1-RELATED SEQUENCE 5-like n=1 Tax=Humulus lupulus TaxID=3486 RepID=UPI002B417654|nr:protein FAR1-RELATED SEQUENCE 5-like [Humulus lupulus]
MEFDTEEEAYHFYNAYAYKIGFSIRRSKMHKDLEGWITNRVFCCSCEGYREKDKRDVTVKSHRAETRFGCLARMKIYHQNGKYHVVEFIIDHAHMTSSPSKSHLHRSQRKLTLSQASEIDLADISGIPPKASYDLMARRVGGRENLGYTIDDCRNYLQTKRTIQMRSGDTRGNARKKAKDYSHRPRCINDKSFIFSMARNNSSPMYLAYIQNAAKHLSGVFEHFREFTKDFSSCIYDYEEKDEFFEAWNNMLKKYDLSSNKWLRDMFDLKEKWALVYGRETFCADMTTTQRSESMNNVIKNHVSYKYDIPRFFQHFQRLVEDRRHDELKADFNATQRALSLSLPIEILKHASIVYTPAVFRMFERELCKACDCAMNIQNEVGTVTEYKITPHGKHLNHIVMYDSSNGTVTCSCKKINFAGILCAHILKVYSSRNVKRIPYQYILKRWTNYSKTGNSTTEQGESMSVGDAKKNNGKTLQRIVQNANSYSNKSCKR